MKANEAPEKIWIDPTSDLPKLSGHIDKDSVEYTRTDAFIQKACDVFCKVCKMPNCRNNECKWISDFKEHLENI